MYSYRTLEIKGYRDEVVPNTLLWQESRAQQVAIILPGIGYTCHMPLLYYPSKALLALGMDVLWVEYNFIRRPDFRRLSSAEQNQWLLADVTAACQVALSERAYREIMFIGKSLGTRAMAQVIANDATIVQSRDVWITPVLRDDQVKEQIRRRPYGLVVIGTADPYYDPAYLTALQEDTRNEVMLVEGADHNMEIEGDFGRSLVVLEKVTRAVQGFASTSHAG